MTKKIAQQIILIILITTPIMLRYSQIIYPSIVLVYPALFVAINKSKLLL